MLPNLKSARKVKSALGIAQLLWYVVPGKMTENFTRFAKRKKQQSFFEMPKKTFIG